ncbi:hypothetical protein KQI84_03660 [bacterium]|nr:hypothetical protein [bacterium]
MSDEQNSPQPTAPEAPQKPEKIKYSLHWAILLAVFLGFALVVILESVASKEGSTAIASAVGHAMGALIFSLILSGIAFLLARRSRVVANIIFALVATLFIAEGSVVALAQIVSREKAASYDEVSELAIQDFTADMQGLRVALEESSQQWMDSGGLNMSTNPSVEEIDQRITYAKGYQKGHEDSLKAMEELPSKVENLLKEKGAWNSQSENRLREDSATVRAKGADQRKLFQARIEFAKTSVKYLEALKASRDDWECDPDVGVPEFSADFPQDELDRINGLLMKIQELAVTISELEQQVYGSQ